MKSVVWPILAACAIVAPVVLAQPEVGPRQRHGPAPEAARQPMSDRQPMPERESRGPISDRPRDRAPLGRREQSFGPQGRGTPRFVGPPCDCPCHGHAGPHHGGPQSHRGADGGRGFGGRFDDARGRHDDRRTHLRELMLRREAFERGFEFGRRTAPGARGQSGPSHAAPRGMGSQGQRPMSPPGRAQRDDDRSAAGARPELREHLRQRFDGDVPPEGLERLRQRMAEPAVPQPRGPRADQPHGQNDDRRPRMNDRPQHAPPPDAEKPGERQPPRRRPL